MLRLSGNMGHENQELSMNDSGANTSLALPELALRNHSLARHLQLRAG